MLRFLFAASRGYRLRPWRSPYLCWRIETFWGIHADQITFAGFWGFCWAHRRELWRFLKWSAHMPKKLAPTPGGATSSDAASGRLRLD